MLQFLRCACESGVRKLVLRQFLRSSQAPLRHACSHSGHTTGKEIMNRRPGRLPILASALVAALAVGAGAGAIVYSAVSSPNTKTVVRQVPVANSEPTANNSALTVGEIYRRAYKGV